MYIRISWQQLTKRFASIAMTFLIGVAIFIIYNYQSEFVEPQFTEISDIKAFNSKFILSSPECKRKPFKLKIFADESRKIIFSDGESRERYYTIDNLGEVKSRLRAIFDEREKRKLVVGEANYKDKIVSVYISNSVKQNDALTIFETLKEAGSHSLELENELFEDDVAVSK
ncbi:MAG: hypothetical protein H7Z37_13785 [Pyrinomonadaceae bacterium]|nr:hypothetical protein [Pyrinomonadaceae bacterium]